MKRFFSRVKAVFVCALSFVLFLSTSVFASATEATRPIITFDIDPAPILATVIFIFCLLIALILALFFLLRHLSETKRRVRRISKIETDDTIQLYDDLNDEMWSDEPSYEDNPPEVLLDDGNSKSKSSSGRIVPSDDKKKEDYQGLIPEREMPGFDPSIYEDTEEIDPVSTQNLASEIPYSVSFSEQTPPPVQQGAYPYPASVQPVVYRPDSDVEIIMNDTSAVSADSSVNVLCNLTPTEESAPQPTKVRAYRRRGKVPGLITHAPRRAVAHAAAAISPEELIEGASSVVGERRAPYGITHLNITPRRGAGVNPEREDEELLQSYEFDENITADEAAENLPLAEAPIETVEENEELSVKLVPPLAKSEEPLVVRLGDDIVDGKLIRTLDDVLDELDKGETVIEAVEEPVHVEELVFLGGGISMDDVVSEDEIFDDEDGEARMFVDGKYRTVRYKTSFLARFIQAEEKVQDYYSVLKNALMSYDSIEQEITWSCETFTHNGEVCAKINVIDKMLVLYLALDPDRYDKYKYHYAYTAKYKGASIPLLIKIKSEKALKYALELIVDLMDELAIKYVSMPDVDYRRSYETVPALIERGLIKVIPTSDDCDADGADTHDEISDKLDLIEKSEAVDIDNGAVFDFSEPMIITIDDTDTPIAITDTEEQLTSDVEVAEMVNEPNQAELDVKVEEPSRKVIHADAVSADMLLSDEEAIASIELVEGDAEARNGKMCEVNLDSICERFNDGDTVTLAELKAKRLVSQNAARVKVLARGTMTKALTIYADRFSLQAVKMITLAGGRAEQYK